MVHCHTVNQKKNVILQCFDG